MKRLAVCAVVVNQQGQVLLGLRTEDKLLCLPGGKVEEGETLREALKREIFEETGILADGFIPINAEEDDEFVCIYYFCTTRQEPKNPEFLKFHYWEWFYTFKLPEVCYKFTSKTIKRYVELRTLLK